jgi:hypothetical protein
MARFVVIAASSAGIWSQEFANKEAAEEARLFLESVPDTKLKIIAQRDRDKRRDDDDDEEGGRG